MWQNIPSEFLGEGLHGSKVRSQKADVIPQHCFTEQTNLQHNGNLGWAYEGGLQLATTKQDVLTPTPPAHLTLQLSLILGNYQWTRFHRGLKKIFSKIPTSSRVWYNSMELYVLLEKSIVGTNRKERRGFVRKHVTSKLVVLELLQFEITSLKAGYFLF